MSSFAKFSLAVLCDLSDGNQNPYQCRPCAFPMLSLPTVVIPMDRTTGHRTERQEQSQRNNYLFHLIHLTCLERMGNPCAIQLQAISERRTRLIHGPDASPSRNIDEWRK